MSPTNLPLSLYKANLELNQRISHLLQQTGQQWLDMNNRLIGEGVAQARAEAEQLVKAQGWQALASLPGEAFWRQLQQRIGDVQAATQIAISTQTMFARGLQEALRQWQQETSQALGDTGTQTPMHGAWNDLMKSWQAFPPDVADLQGKPETTTGGGARRGK